jgi:hypothetical protein
MGRTSGAITTEKKQCDHASRQLENLQRVEKFECGSLAPDNVERERGARAGALPLEQKAGG